MKDTKISLLESEWNRHKQAYSMWIGITEEQEEEIKAAQLDST
jgi:hypothetical protein